MSEQGGEECPWCSQSVDAQRIVATVVIGPFVVADESWRQCVQLEVANAVTAHHHGGMLLIERLDDALERLWRRIEVVAVELHGKSSASFIVDGHVPASANAEVCALGNDVYEVRIGLFQLIQDVSCAVG